MINKSREAKRKQFMESKKTKKIPPKSYFSNKERAFITPLDVKFRTITRTNPETGKITNTIQARFSGYLAGNEADYVAQLVNLNKSFRTDGGIWIISKSKHKQILQLGVKELPHANN